MKLLRGVAVTLLVLTSPVWLAFAYGLLVNLTPIRGPSYAHMGLMGQQDLVVRQFAWHWWRSGVGGLSATEAMDAATNMLRLSYNLGLSVWCIVLLLSYLLVVIPLSTLYNWLRPDRWPACPDWCPDLWSPYPAAQADHHQHLRWQPLPPGKGFLAHPPEYTLYREPE